MNLDLADVGAVLVVFASLALVILRIFVISGANFEALLVPRTGFEWPRGVPEEPVRWKVERLMPRDQRLPAGIDSSPLPHAPSGLRSAVRRELSVGERSSKPAS